LATFETSNQLELKLCLRVSKKLDLYSSIIYFLILENNLNEPANVSMIYCTPTMDTLACVSVYILGNTAYRKRQMNGNPSKFIATDWLYSYIFIGCIAQNNINVV
jgi:hypothetical protein